MGVIRSPLIHQRSVAGHEGQQHPARAAAERLAHRDELGAPTLDAAEIGLECQFHGRNHGLAVAAERREVQLVEQHRVRRDQLLALQPVDREARNGSPVQGVELLADPVQPLDRSAVVVLMVAGYQALRQAA